MPKKENQIFWVFLLLLLSCFVLLQSVSGYKLPGKIRRGLPMSGGLYGKRADLYYNQDDSEDSLNSFEYPARQARVPLNGGLYGKRIPLSGGLYGKRGRVADLSADSNNRRPHEKKVVPLSGGLYGK